MTSNAPWKRIRKRKADMKTIMTMLLLVAWLFSGLSPPNDFFDSATPLVGRWAFVEGTNTDATAEPDEPQHAGVASTNSVWWNWGAPYSFDVVIETDFFLAVAMTSTRFWLFMSARVCRRSAQLRPMTTGIAKPGAELCSERLPAKLITSP